MPELAWKKSKQSAFYHSLYSNFLGPPPTFLLHWCFSVPDELLRFLHPIILILIRSLMQQSQSQSQSQSQIVIIPPDPAAPPAITKPPYPPYHYHHLPYSIFDPLRSFKRVPTLKTRKKPNKRTVKKRIYPAGRKYRKKIQFRRKFRLPGGSSPLLVSSSDVRRGVNFTFKGKSYKLTLRQMIKLLQRRKGDSKMHPKGGSKRGCIF